MSELDLINAIRETADSGGGHVMNFVTGLFAFLVASHFIANQLSRVSVAILVGIFSMFSLISGLSSVVATRDLKALVEALAAIPEREILTPANPGLVDGMSWVVGIALVGGYSAGLVFLRECRKRPKSSRVSPAV